MPPPVEPAEAPRNMQKSKMVWEREGHFSKSAVVYPVVVMMEMTWKPPKRMASEKVSYTV